MDDLRERIHELTTKAGNTGKRGGQIGNSNAEGVHKVGTRVAHAVHGEGTVTGSNARHTFVQFDKANPVDRMMGPRPVAHGTLRAIADTRTPSTPPAPAQPAPKINRYDADEDVPLEHFQVGQKVRFARRAGNSDWKMHEVGDEAVVGTVNQTYSPRAGKNVVYSVTLQGESGEFMPHHFERTQ